MQSCAGVVDSGFDLTNCLLANEFSDDGFGDTPLCTDCTLSDFYDTSDAFDRFGNYDGVDYFLDQFRFAVCMYVCMYVLVT